MEDLAGLCVQSLLGLCVFKEKGVPFFWMWQGFSHIRIGQKILSSEKTKDEMMVMFLIPPFCSMPRGHNLGSIF